MKPRNFEILVSVNRIQPLLTLAALSITLASCGGGGGDNPVVADASFNISRAAFNGGVLAIAPGIDGAIDSGFDFGSGFNNNVGVIVPANDGSGDIYVGGTFTDYDGASANRIIRLNSDGTVDSEFVFGSGFNDEVASIAPATDGSGDVYIGGNFFSYQGMSYQRIIRLNADGSVDAKFDPQTGFDNAVRAISLATDGSGDVYVGGDFEFYDGRSANYAIRLNSDGTVDTGFATGSGFNFSVLQFAPTTDGSGDVFVAGVFRSYNGANSEGIIRLNANGTVDAGFDVGTGLDSGSNSIALATDGSGDVYLAGFFRRYNGTDSAGIIRLNANGTIDAGFDVGAGFDTGAFEIALATDGSGDIYAGGPFTSYNGMESNRVIRLNSDGTKDTGFAIGIGFDSNVFALAPAIDGSGDVYFGGTFNSYNGSASTKLVRLEVGRTWVGGAFENVNDSIGSNHIGVLNADDSRDADFAIGTGFDFDVFALAPDTSGSGDTYVGGSFLSYDGASSSFFARLNSNGTRDAGFDVGAGFDNIVLAILPAPDSTNNVYVGGSFTNYNGTNSNRFIRLRANGSVEGSFDVQSGFDSDVIAIAAATDGSLDVYVGGGFSSYRGVGSSRIVRLNEDASRDNGFDLGFGFNGDVHAIAPAVDGTTDVYIGGRFTDYNGTSSNRIIRLNADGTVDSAFTVGSGFDNDVNEIAPATDGSGDVYVGGDFVSYDGTSANRMVRLNADGSRDTGFAIGPGFDGSIFSIAVETDQSGDVHVGGMFTSFNELGSNGIIRLDVNGAVKNGFGFGTGLDDFAFAIIAAEDGSGDVFVGGEFLEYDGNGASGLIRLNADGEKDTEFDVGTGFDDGVQALAALMDGSGDVYVGGKFLSYNGTVANRIIRLNADGTRDTAFDVGTGFDGVVLTIALAKDGSNDVFIGGQFNNYNGTGSNRIIRLKANGTREESFDVGAGFDSDVNAIAATTDSSGDVYVGGGFSKYRGTFTNNLVRLRPDGTSDPVFANGSMLNADVEVIAVAMDGSNDLYVGGEFSRYGTLGANFIIRLNDNSTRDFDFDLGTGFDDDVEALAIASDGSGDIYVGGDLRNYKGTSANRIIRLNSDGSRDVEFDVGAGFNDDVLAIAAAKDGSLDIYVGGKFTRCDQSQVEFAAALNSDGSLD